MHCHILPGLDDGAKTMEETMATLKEASRQGVKRMIVTPHFHPERYAVEASETEEALEKVREECLRQNVQVAIYPGQECLYYSGLVKLLDREKVLTLAGSNYVLVEFEPNCMFSYLQSGLRELRSCGYIPILAHFERYQCLYKKEYLEEIREQGFLLQMNFDRLLEADSFFHKNRWRKLIKEGIVDFLGSDCHGMDFRPLHVEAAYRWIQANLDLSQQKRMLEDNIKNILESRR